MTERQSVNAEIPGRSGKSLCLRFATAVTIMTMPAAAMAEDAGVPYGSEKEAFIEALADMEPVQLTMQAFSTPSDIQSLPIENLAKRIDEWSGGKITTKVVYGSAIIRGNMAPAVVDGRLSYGGIIAQYDPSNFPVGAALVDLSYVPSQEPLTGVLASYGTLLETANGTPEAWEEQRKYGIEPGYLMGGSQPTGIYCTEEVSKLGDFPGLQIRTGGLVHGKQIEALGATAVTLPFPEVFEGLQRGIIDCALTAPLIGVMTGIIPVAPHFTVNPKNGFGLISTNWAFDAVLWEELPLAARQLLYDSQKVFLETRILVDWHTNQVAAKNFVENGGGIHLLAEDAGAAIANANAAILEEARTNAVFRDPEDVVTRLVANREKWSSIISELGYTDIEPGWDGFAEWYSDDKVDAKPFVDRLYKEAMLEHRPK